MGDERGLGETSEPCGDEIRIGISACLLGSNVRFDGGHKRDGFLVETVGRFVTWVAVCPEVEIGLGTPRETLRLIRTGGGELRMVAARSGHDPTDDMRRYAAARTAELEGLDLSGYILKKGSPSCGMERVRVYGAAGAPARNGRGLFAEALMTRMPFLPVEEEGRLQDPKLRENFFERVFAYRRLRRQLSGGVTTGELVRFHSREKLLLLAHDPARHRELGRLVAAAKGRGRVALGREYFEGFMTALAKIATTKKQTNVLQHAAGYFKKLLDGDDRSELARVIEDYRLGLTPLVVPLTLLRHHVRRHRVSYLLDQTYLEPHPKELMLRNHV